MNIRTRLAGSVGNEIIRYRWVRVKQNARCQRLVLQAYHGKTVAVLGEISMGNHVEMPDHPDEILQVISDCRRYFRAAPALLDAPGCYLMDCYSLDHLDDWVTESSQHA